MSQPFHVPLGYKLDKLLHVAQRTWARMSMAAQFTPEDWKQPSLSIKERGNKLSYAHTVDYTQWVNSNTI